MCRAMASSVIGSLGLPNSYSPWWLTMRCFSRSEQLAGELLAGELLGFGDFGFDQADDHDDVADELAFVAVAELALVGQFVDLAGVVQKSAEQQQVADRARDRAARRRGRPPSG